MRYRWAALLWLLLAAPNEAQGQQGQELECQALRKKPTTEGCNRSCNSGKGACPSSQCICSINPYSAQPAEVTLLRGEERCFAFRATDDDVHLMLQVNATAAAAAGAVVYLRASTGPEGERRKPTSRDHDLKAQADGEVVRLSRSQWRDEIAAKDEGEWVGEWTMCATGAGTISARVVFSPCLADDGGQECYGHGTCSERVAYDDDCPGIIQRCRQDYCDPLIGFGNTVVMGIPVKGMMSKAGKAASNYMEVGMTEMGSPV